MAKARPTLAKTVFTLVVLTI